MGILHPLQQLPDKERKEQRWDLLTIETLASFSGDVDGAGSLGSHDMRSKKETSRPLPPKRLILEISAGATGAKRRQLGDLEVWEAQGSFL